MSTGDRGKNDLTRWNRPGLRRFRYVDANAAVFLEELRLRLAKRFTDRWKALPQEPENEVERESPLARDARFVAQYQAPRSPVPDWGWEISRSLARACHVLGETIDAHANEGYLGTATQWESVRRIVALIDHRPGPPASASTHLCIEAKAPGKLDKGFPVQYTSPTGEPPIVFETLEDIEIDPALDVLRPANWDRSPDVLHGTWIKLEGRVEGIVVGEPVVLERESDGRFDAHVVTSVIEEESRTEIRVARRIASNTFTKGNTIIHAAPSDRLRPLGPTQDGATLGTTIWLARPADGLQPGEIITISDGLKRVYRRVKSIHGLRIVLDRPVGEMRVAQATVSKPVPLSVSKQGGRTTSQGAVIQAVMVPGDLSRLAGQFVADVRVLQNRNVIGMFQVMSADYHPIGAEAEGVAHPGYTTLRLGQHGDSEIPINVLRNPQTLLMPPPGAGTWELEPALRADDAMSRLPEVLITSQPKKLTPGDLAVAVMGRQASWGRLASVDVDHENGLARLRSHGNAWQGCGGSDFRHASTIVYGHFKSRARVLGWRDNTTPIHGNSVSLANVPALLGRGRRVIVEKDGDPGIALPNTVESVNRKNGVLTLRDRLPEGFTRSTLKIAANVVLAGQGESRPDKVLGSGNATRSNQAFVLQDPDVSFVADPSQPGGVRADIEVRVDGQLWSQVGSFSGRGPTEPVFTVQMTEDGYLVLVFGDGQRGRRLPTGQNNVRIRYRTGAGLRGNLSPGKLTQPKHPHPLVAAVRQPLLATGGNDMESVASLRESAPATVLALGRCVSLSDFEAVAVAHSSVWQARASAASSPGRGQKVEVVVVPAGGGGLGELKDTLAAYLEAHAVPGVAVTVLPYEAKRVGFNIKLWIDTRAHAPDRVMQAVRDALRDALSLQRRKLGQALWLSDVYRVVEAVTGVESSFCTFQDDDTGVNDVIASLLDEVVFLGPEEQHLAMTYEEHRP